MSSHSTGDIHGAHFLGKHVGRGFDSVALYRLDDRSVLRGTRFYRRYGAPALVALAGRRLVTDWARIVRYRRQMDLSVATLPWAALVCAGLRSLELVGMLAAIARPGLLDGKARQL